MIEKWLDIVNKASGYIFTPFAYPTGFFKNVGSTFTNRSLVRELVHLTPMRKWYRSKGFATVLDVGAFIGAYAYAMKYILPDAQVFSFEPLPDNFAKLSKNMKPFKGWNGFNTAVGDSTGSMDFYKNEFAASSSALPMEDLHRQAFPQTQKSEKVSVPVTTLDNIFQNIALKSPVLLKIDVQGFELSVLEGAEQLLKQVDCIVCEVSYIPLYQGQAVFPEVFHLLKHSGFRYGGSLENLHSPIDGSILQSDAVFLHE